ALNLEDHLASGYESNAAMREFKECVQPMEVTILEQTWLQDLVNAEKPPLTFDDLMSTLIDFSVFAMNHLKIDKLTKADLGKSNIELEYNMDQCYNALTDQLDWTNPEGDKHSYDLSKPLPLQGSPGHLTIHVDFFFNNDLEYLKTSNSERKYTISITKTKVARLTRYGYGYLEEIVVRRADRKLYTCKEGDDIINVAVALRMFTRSLVIKKRVEDVQLGVESYQKYLNITPSQKEFPKISSKKPFTTSYYPQGVVYLNSREHKKLMQADELYKSSDGTLISVCEIL
nr:hypothetical protein [Tanacetum cinerariifolium]